MNALNLKSIDVQFPDGDGVVKALDNVDLTVDAGEFLAITGPSGSGKSTLLAVAGLLLSPTSGTVELDGKDVTNASAKERTDLRRNAIGFVFQQPHLLASLTAVDQLMMVARLDGDRSQDAKKRAMQLLDNVGLAKFADRHPAHLSGGQRQRVGIARALMNSPKLLLVDEPTSALDHERGVAVIDLLRGLTDDQGLATVVVTHDLAALKPGDEIVRLVDGRLASTARADA